MNVETRLRAIHLMELLEENREYAEDLGIEWKHSHPLGSSSDPTKTGSSAMRRELREE